MKSNSATKASPTMRAQIMATEMYVYLTIEKFSVDPDEISRMVGVKPTLVRRKGDQIGKSILKARYNSWEYRVSVNSKYELEPQVKKILSKFKNKRSLKKAIGCGDAEIFCVFYANDREPIISLSASTLTELADLGLGFSLDYYLSS